MAILHSDFLLGNDTTGDGSAALPYKTIVKSLQVAANGDTVKVAGGQFVDTGATATGVARGTSVTTSIDLTGSIAVGDLISIDTSSVDGFPLQANVYQVGAITSTTITFRSGLFVNTPGTFSIYKLNTIHYNSSSFPTFETATGITATQVNVEGGWDSTFTTQFGWTGVNRIAATSSTSGAFMSWNALVRPEIVFNKFLICNIQGFTGSGSSIGINELALAFGTNSSQSPFGISNFGVYAPSSIGFTTIYSNGYNLTASWNGSINRPTTLNLKQWMSYGVVSNIKSGFAASEGAISGPSIRNLEVHWRSSGNQPNTTILGVIGGQSIGDIYIDELTMYIAGNTIHPIMNEWSTSSAWRYIGNINTVNTDGSNTGITPYQGSLNTSSLSAARISPINLNRTSGTFEQLPWMSYGSSSASRAVIISQFGMMFGRDSTGNQKVIDGESIVRWADTTDYVTGSNSLRLKLLTNTSGSDTIPYMIGTLNKPATTFTVTVKMKASKNIQIGNLSNQIYLQYGPASGAVVLVVPSTVSIGTSWQDITFTINPSTVTNWNLGDDGLMQVVIPVRTSQVINPSEVVYLWVDSITLS